LVRAVVLDALGTLVRLEDPRPRLVAGLARLGVEVSHEQAGVALRAEIAYDRAHHDEGADERRLEALRRRCAEVLAAALPVAARRLPRAALLGALLDALRFVPYPEAHDCLRALRARPARPRLVVLSNWDVSLHRQLAATGLDRLVDAALSSAEAGAAKPDPAAFAGALALVGVPAREALMVGDDLVADVLGARAAGLRAVLVDRGGAGAPEGVAAIGSLRELPGLVESLA
jgi:putative hydrolase of the HAD superfamily